MSNIGQIHRKEYEIENSRSVSFPIAIAEAPGRIHLLGEEGQHQSALFLSAAIDRYIHLAVSPRKDNSLRFFASDLGERKRSTLINLKYRREDRWANFIKTAIFTFLDLGCSLQGLNFTFCGDIPQHIGLASSVAIEVAAALALKSLLHVKISESELARRLCDVHISLFGKEVPLVDYQVCLFAKKNQFLVLDSSAAGKPEEIRRINSSISKYKILLVDSRVPRAGAERELASRRTDALKGLKYLTKNHEGTLFKDFASNDLLEALGNFPEHIRRRTMHIVEEIRRVNEAADMLERKDIASFAKLIFHSHESLRDLYEISCPEVDWLVKRAQETEGTAGSRITGLGFGGCTYVIIKKELAEEYKKRLDEYERIFGFHPLIYEVKLASGARVTPRKAAPARKTSRARKTSLADGKNKKAPKKVKQVKLKPKAQGKSCAQVTARRKK